MGSRWVAREHYRDSLLINNKFNTFWDVYKKGLAAFFLVKGGLLLYRQRQRLSDASFTLPVLALTFNYLLAWLAASVLSCVFGIASTCCRPRVKSCIVGFAYVLHVFFEYAVSVTLIVLSIMGFHKNLIVGNDHVMANFYLNGMIFFGLMIFKDLLDLCWIRTLISEHVFNMDLDNYLADQDMVERIRQDITEIRKIQIDHAVDVDTKDPYINVLFSEEFSEEHIVEYEKNRLRRLARAALEDDDQEGSKIKPKNPKAQKQKQQEPSIELNSVSPSQNQPPSEGWSKQITAVEVA